jgi:hypothetical protein
VQVTSTASTTRWRDCVGCLPHRTAAAMRADDVAIQLTVAVEHPPRARRRSAWPLRLSRRSVQGLEGLPVRIGVSQASTRVGKREVFVTVFFGRAVPTNRQLRRANAELARARFG